MSRHSAPGRSGNPAPIVVWRGQTLTLGQADFVAQGGQARVYARDGMALKVFTTAVPSPAKLAILRRCRHPHILTPEEDVFDSAGTPVGFSMPLLDGWRPLVTLFPRVYRERHQLDVDAVGALVLKLRALVQHAHRHQALIVDLNELNVLVSPDHTEVALIDVDSWQVPGHPASALAASVQDHRSTGFTKGTDWYAFAVLAFQLFSGIHPYRARHPTVKPLEDRMKQLLSVFHPDVVVPPMAELEVPWRTWFVSLFAQGDRTPPPSALDAVTAGIPTVLHGSVTVHEGFRLPSPLLGTASWDGRSWSWTRDGLYEGGRRVGDAPGDGLPCRGPDGIAFAPRELEAKDLTAHRGMLHGRVGPHLVEYSPVSFGGTSWRARVAAQIAPFATRLFRGVAVTRVLGSTWLHLLEPGKAVQRREPRLDGLRVIDAVHTSGVTVVITKEAGAYVRHVFGADGHRTTPTDLPAAHLVVLPTGVALVQTDDGLEVFAARAPCGAVRRVPVALTAPVRLLDGRPGFIAGDTWHTLSLG